MKVIILAAGVGKRLGNAADDKPKCLLNFDGKSLLARHLEILQSIGVDGIHLVTGYRQQDIESHLNDIANVTPLQLHFNPDYTEGSIVSLWHTRQILKEGGEIILMDADVLYDPRILARLIEGEATNAFLLDRDFEPGEEPVKLCVRDSVIVDFRKQIAPDLRFDLQGESVGFFRFSPGLAARLAERLQAWLDNGRRDEPYEEVIRELLLETPAEFSYLDITGLPWIEIDFPEDVDRARRLMHNHATHLQ
ncbi:MAG: phosphocholine cytidylyltransferase family protein [Gammaproteobacteria bacterium]|nr:MAG: phosphocholine cytidylyltransferase family protein [Gammaproteobacteria bacterium]